jgi:hypothetical protein
MSATHLVRATFVMLLAAVATAQTQSVVYTFTASNSGANPFAGLAFDKAGHAYGTTLQGGTGGCDFPYPIGCGTVFELIPIPSTVGESWLERVIYSFQGGSDGAYPQAALAIDRFGNLYGTTYAGGGDGCVVAGCGTVFELQPSQEGWVETVLYRFTNTANGANPSAGLILDQNGNLYGTTYYGGNQSCDQEGPGCGTVFELKRSQSGPYPTWQELVLHSFDQGDGAHPSAALTFDRNGNLYGDTLAGGDGRGVIFQLTFTSDGWAESILYNFEGGLSDGEPVGQLVLDRAGNVYGVTSTDGANGLGSVFELTRSGSDWVLSFLHSFDGTDGWFPASGVIPDDAGNLYGVTPDGGNGNCQYGCGVVFRLSREENWSDTVLYYFQGGSDGFDALGNLAIDKGVLYGTTVAGGDSNCSALPSEEGCGVIFSIAPSAIAPEQQAATTPSPH